MTTAPLASPPAAPVGPSLGPAPRAAVAVALGLAVAAAVLVPGGPPGAGVALLAALTVVVLGRVQPLLAPGVALTRWQRVHAAGAVLLAGGAALRDAPWVVALDLLGATGLGALALAPATGGAAVLVRGVRLAAQVVPGAHRLGLGLRVALGHVRTRGPAVTGLALTGLVLAVFGPLLATADPRFAALMPSVDLRVDGPGGLVARLVVAAATAVLVAAAVQVMARPGTTPVLPPPRRKLDSVSEWLLPLGALDLLLAGFVALQATRGSGTSYADQVHAGFWQLLVVTALVLGVVAATARWTALTGGVRAALGGLCVLTLAVDATALARLHGYTEAYGLTRLRYGVGLTCVALAGVLVLVLVAGTTRRERLPHGVVLVVALTLLGATLADPDAAVARSAVARGDAADTDYLRGLSADAVPALLDLPQPARDCVLTDAATRLGAAPWTSANRSRLRARDLLVQQCLQPGVQVWTPAQC